MKRKYAKKDKRYWEGDHYFNILGILFITLMVGMTVTAGMMKEEKLISPVVEIAEAKEPEVKISCEDPKGYLECKAYAGAITWAQHDRISKIIACESGWNPDAYHVNTNGTVDLGLVQINSIHKNISNADKLNFKKAIDWMIAKVKADGGYGAWVCNRKIK